MATTTKGLKGFKSTGNPLLDALVIMSLVPGTGGMAADEEVGKDLGALFNKIKPFKQGGEATELPEASVEGVEKILKEDPRAARGANVPSDPAERAKMIQQFMAKQKEAPAQPSPSTPPSPAGAPALEQLASPSPAKAVRAPKTAGGKPGPMQLSQVNKRFINSIEEAQRRDILEPAEKVRQIYQYLKGKLPDTPKRAYGWDRKIKAIDVDIDAYLKPDAFKKLTTDTTEEERQLNNWRINQLRERYETELKRANEILQGLTAKR